MVEESYVSFETAKLLYEKGFIGTPENFHYLYGKDGSFGHRNSLWSEEMYPAPSLEMAMRWLREVHNLCIEPYRTASGYLYTISKIWTGSELYSDEFNGDDEASGQWTTWEKAVEAAIKYCLEYLIT